MIWVVLVAEYLNLIYVAEIVSTPGLQLLRFEFVCESIIAFQNIFTAIQIAIIKYIKDYRFHVEIRMLGGSVVIKNLPKM